LSILEQADLLRIKANSLLNKKLKSELGQFFTSGPISLYMASLFDEMQGDLKVLDPGCGTGSLSTALVNEALHRESIHSIHIDAFDVDSNLKPFFDEIFLSCQHEAQKLNIQLAVEFHLKDFILNYSNSDNSDYSHVIMNPPYKKIARQSEHRKLLRDIGIETVNLYSGFVALAIKKLKIGGELVAIIPRSFCNGPYYKAFRELILKETALRHIHIFDSRSKAFDDVLQENIIIHLIKGATQKKVTITSSPAADFHIDKDNISITATDKTVRVVDFESIVRPDDKQRFIHIASNERDQQIIDRLSCFNTQLSDLAIEVSTGPVVGFRLKKHLLDKFAHGSAALIYPIHLNGNVEWPKTSKKANAISITEETRKWLWVNKGNFLLVNRFSSKDQKRRIYATFYDGDIPSDLVGFDNKINVYHSSKQGIDTNLARGLFIYLNSTLLDKYYRLFGGHTQINATDLRTIHYPNYESLVRIGKEATNLKLDQNQIDKILEKEIIRMSGDISNPLNQQEKLDQALEIIKALGLPKAQQNERSALTLLSLVNLAPSGNWQDIEPMLIGVTPIMDWCRDIYGKEYAPNTRETFRRQTLHQFVDGGLCAYNPDKPDRPVNSPKACYQLIPETFALLRNYGTENWDIELADWLKKKSTLTQQYAMARDMEMIPLTLDDGSIIKLSPGIHSQLIHDIVSDFGPRFAPGSEVIYLGDTGAKEDFFRKNRLAELGVIVDRKGKLPDVVLYWPEKDWLLLIESVTSHGPVDGKRHLELSKLFQHASPGLVYVTAFPDRKTMSKFLCDISWETEVWAAEAPTHMIHFNGDRFLGPHT
jgi:adenine-specific DNA-methyltransferase